MREKNHSQCADLLVWLCLVVSLVSEEIQLEKILGRGGAYADPLLLFKIKKEMMSVA